MDLKLQFPGRESWILVTFREDIERNGSRQRVSATATAKGRLMADPFRDQNNLRRYASHCASQLLSACLRLLPNLPSRTQLSVQWQE